MKSKSLIITVVAIIISIFSITYSMAANNTMDNVANGVRNVVGGAGNMIEGAGNAVGNTVKNGMNTIANGAENVGNATRNTVGAMTSDNNDNYDATRTAAIGGVNADAGTGINTTTYTWVIIGITAVAIGFLLWSYFRQSSNNNIYIDSEDR